MTPDQEIAAITRAVAYDPLTGDLRRRVGAGPAKVGDSVGYKSKDGTLHCVIKGKEYLVHRLAWLLTHGQWPNFLTHLDGNKQNNKLENLRDVPKPRCSALTHTRVRDLLDYDPETGKFFWRVNISHGTVGKEAGAVHALGYVEVSIDTKSYKAHRLAWLYVFGHWPEHEIDHVNGVRDDNRLANLRQATRVQNMQNKTRYKSNKSGTIGVYFHKKTGKWVSAIQSAGKRKHLGVFNSIDQASAAYQTAKREMHLFQPTIREGALA